ncbi:hypothetical protein MNBD_GAMMA21-1082 [hydrothermal vent metagenome]|uniref:Type IV pilin Tt1218-like domain-containing protein n=1 Tax=hydrothermal vent metagenome TaxID=652676 RepID=A0A3B0ZVV2_9ZZZZ
MNHTKLAGFTLLEVMIALVIFSIGLLGLAGMQAAGIRNNQISYTRTVATQLAYDMADRIRNNPTANYAAAVPAAVPNCVTGTCTSPELASFDLMEWNTAINNPAINPAIKNSASPLRNGAGYISQMTTASGIVFYRVSVTWDESNNGPTTAAINAAECGPPVVAGKVCITVDAFP